MGHIHLLIVEKEDTACMILKSAVISLEHCAANYFLKSKNIYKNNIIIFKLF